MSKEKILEEYNLTEREVEVLKALQTLGYEWLARDLDGELFAFKKMIRAWVPDNYTITAHIDKDLFTFIKTEDKEPTNIKELLE